MKKESVSTSAKKTSITITKYYQDVIKREMKNGKYGSTSEVIRAGLRLLDEKNKKQTKQEKGKKQI